eukprot:TRINITY_DN6639_c0_g1_i1.p1 TRINITY_DN6639_c0_g1~~TRINITY_DN6639_c0_g1_i1.p1  ORF type:complete len:193 (-),score=28.52 TRINITY_DN6639_c0_g1_i1:58-636(-)
MVLVFIIVGKNDRPLYELEMYSDGRTVGGASSSSASTVTSGPAGSSSSTSTLMASGMGQSTSSLPELLSMTPFPRPASDPSSSSRKEDSHLSHFIIHSSLDIVDEAVWRNKDVYLKTVERYGTMAVSAYVTPGHIRFMLLHNNKNEESIRLFFVEAHELYLKMQLNAFYEINSPITSKAFHERISALAGKRL